MRAEDDDEDEGKVMASMPRWSRALMLEWMGGEGVDERAVRCVAEEEDDGSR